MCVDFIMRNLTQPLILLLLFFFSGNVFGQNIDKDKILLIRSQVENINQSLSSYKLITKDDDDQTTEGGEVKGYFSGGEIKRIGAVYYGETGRVRKEYYFANKKLIFYYSFEERYKQPFYTTPGKVIISKKQETRFYFDNGILIKYIYNPIRQMGNGEVRKTEIETQTETKRLLTLFTNKS
jgi:hypothetical protein